MKKVIIAVILFGAIGLSLNLIFGANTFSFLQTYRDQDNHLLFYKIDFYNYLQNLKNSFDSYTQLSIEIPTRQWEDVGLFEWEALGNNLALMLDWVLFTINIFVYPFRIGGYVMLQMLAILGINTIDNNAANGLNWLVEVAKILRNLQISYV